MPKSPLAIDKLHCTNFGPLKDTTVDFTPLTVLVGKNDSGKTMILEALARLGSAVRSHEGFRGSFGQGAALDLWTFKRAGGAIRFEISGAVRSGARFEYVVSADSNQPYGNTVEERFMAGRNLVLKNNDAFTEDPNGTRAKVAQINPNGLLLDQNNISIVKSAAESQGTAGAGLKALSEQMLEVHEFFRPLRRFRFLPQRLRAPVPIHSTLLLHEDGYGLAAIVHDLLTRRRKTLNEIEEALRNALPEFHQIGVETGNRRDFGTISDEEGAGNLNGPTVETSYGIEIVTRDGTTVPSRMISDGFFLMLGYLVLAKTTDTRIVLIDEAETGIHPGLLQRIVTLLRDTIANRGGVQVILTTHSPILLNWVQPEEIRIVDRSTGATLVHPFNSRPEVERMLEYQGPGELWLNETEEQLIPLPVS